MKYLDLTKDQKMFVMQNYSEHFDDIYLIHALHKILNPNANMKIDRNITVFDMPFHLHINDDLLMDKLEFLNDVCICIILDAIDREWFELANNFEHFIWLINFTLKERSLLTVNAKSH